MPSPALLALALEPESQRLPDASAQRILDAALEEAAASGVCRMTVYRRFGSKDRLVEALAVRECRRCLAELRLVLSFVLNPQSAVGVDDEAAAREFARAFVAPI